MDNAIILNRAEMQSNLDRVKHAEALIKQLHPKHEGRNSWLMNYGQSQEAENIRKKHGELSRKNKKPPIGLLPTHLWKNKRMMDISDAIARYVYNYKKIPNEWIVELEELNEGVK